MAIRFQRKATGRCKGVRELQEREVPFSVGGGAYLKEKGAFQRGKRAFVWSFLDKRGASPAGEGGCF